MDTTARPQVTTADRPRSSRRRGDQKRRGLLAAGLALMATAVLLVVVLDGRPGKEPPIRWQTDLVEDFDTLDPGRWSVSDDWGADNEASWLQADNVSVDDGVLRIQGEPEPAGGRDYTSGRIDTNGKYALPDYFRAEVRAKVPFTQGTWAAPLWLRPVDGGDGEIDLVETYGAEAESPRVHQTIHTSYGEGHDYVSSKTPFSRLDPADPTDWHTYTVEKTPGRIVMWVDGVETARFDASSASWFDEYYEQGSEWNLRVNLQIGGAFGLPDGSTDWSGDNAAMQVDHIRTWVLG